MDFYIDKFTEMIIPACLAATLAAVCFIIARVAFKKKVKMGRAMLYICMAAYLTELLITAIFERGWNPGETPYVNLMPFNDLTSDVVRPTRAILMIGLNTLVFIPWGILLPALYKPFRKVRWILPAGLGMSLAIEITQYVGKIGVFETDDLIFNTLGTILGFIMYKICGIIFLNKSIS